MRAAGLAVVALVLAGCDSGPKVRVINRAKNEASFTSGGWPTQLLPGAWQVLPAPRAEDGYRVEVDEHGAKRCYDLGAFTAKIAAAPANDIYSLEFRDPQMGVGRPSAPRYEAMIDPTPCP